MERKCVKVISGNTFEVDLPVCGSNIIKLAGVEEGNKDRLQELIEGKTVKVIPVVCE